MAVFIFPLDTILKFKPFVHFVRGTFVGTVTWKIYIKEAWFWPQSDDEMGPGDKAPVKSSMWGNGWSQFCSSLSVEGQ